MEMKIYDPYQPPPPRLVKHSDFYLFLEKVQSVELPFIGKIINAYLPYVSEIRTVSIISSISDACTITVYDGEQNVEISLICCGPIISADELKIFQNRTFTHSETISLLMNNRNKNLWLLSEIEMFIRIKRIFGQDLEKIFEEIIKLNNSFAKSYLQVCALNFEYFSSIPNNSENKSSKLEKSSQYNQLSVHHEKVAQRLINVYKLSENMIRKKYLNMEPVYENILSSKSRMTSMTMNPSLATYSIDENLNISSNKVCLVADIASQGGGEGGDRNKRNRSIYVEEAPTKHHRNLGTRLDHFKEMYGNDLSKLTSTKSFNGLDDKKKYKINETSFRNGSSKITSDTAMNCPKVSGNSIELEDPCPQADALTSEAERNSKMVLGLDEKLLCKLSRLLELLRESKKYETDNNTILIGSESKFYSSSNSNSTETKTAATAMTSSSSSSSSFPVLAQTSATKSTEKRKSGLGFDKVAVVDGDPNPPSTQTRLPPALPTHNSPWRIEPAAASSKPLINSWQPVIPSTTTLGHLYLSHPPNDDFMNHGSNAPCEPL